LNPDTDTKASAEITNQDRDNGQSLWSAVLEVSEFPHPLFYRADTRTEINQLIYLRRRPAIDADIR